MDSMGKTTGEKTSQKEKKPISNKTPRENNAPPSDSGEPDKTGQKKSDTGVVKTGAKKSPGRQPTTARKTPGLIQWQTPMVKVLQALTPLMLASIYFFGWRSLLLLIITNITGFLTEYMFVKNEKQPVSSAVFVTNCILALSLPPTIPLWMAGVGTLFGVVFGKMVFGGFGRNIFNPAMVGRAFLYVSFPVFMTSQWMESCTGFPGGLAKWTQDALTSATPLGIISKGGRVPYLNLLLGNIAGSLGETSALLIILAGIYIVYQKVASHRIVLGGLIGMLVMQFILWKAGVPKALDPVSALLGGGFLFGLFFVATDPISAAQTDTGRWIYGVFVGIITVLIRTFSGWAEGMMFAVLLGNMFNPIMDYYIKEYQQSRKRKQVSS